MSTPYRISSTVTVSVLLSLAPLYACAAPSSTPQFIEPPHIGGIYGGDSPAALFELENDPILRGPIDNFTLDYNAKLPYKIRTDKGLILTVPPTSALTNDVLLAKVSVSLRDVSFLAALDALVNVSPKKCRIECREVRPQRVSLDVKNVPLAGLLDSLAKLSSAHLYILPDKLIIAPQRALTEDERRKSRPYGILLTADTLPNTPEAKALLKPNTEGKTILDVANTKVSIGGEGMPLGFVLNSPLGPKVPQSEFTPKVVGPVDKAILESIVSFSLRGVNYGDALASFARLIGCELYLTPNHFIICQPNHLNDPDVQEWTQGSVPALNPDSIESPFSDPKWTRF